MKKWIVEFVKDALPMIIAWGILISIIINAQKDT